MKKLLTITLLLVSWRCFAQDSSSVQLLISGSNHLVKVDGKELGAVLNVKLSAGVHNIAVYKPLVGVYDTSLNCIAGNSYRLLVNFKNNPEYRADIKHRNWKVARKAALYTAAVAALPIGFSGFSESRQKYLDSYDRLQNSPKRYDDARSQKEVVDAKEYIRYTKSEFAAAKKEYRNSCIKAGGFILLSGFFTYLAVKTEIPVIEDKAKIRFDAISINQVQVYPGLKFTVQL